MIINSSNIKFMEDQPDESVHHIITDPPYLINFMNKGWDSENNIAGSPEFWKECLRVTKKGGYALVFGHTRTHHRVMTAIEDAGWEIRDCLMWLQGQGFPKSHDLAPKIDKAKGLIGHRGKRVKHHRGQEHLAKPKATGNYEPISPEAKEWKGWGSALKPAWEVIIMARKPFKGSLTNNVLEHGTGALNIDATRVGSDVMPAQQTKTETTEIGWEKKGYTTPEKTGRFPANVILTHSAGCRKVGETTDIRSGGERTKTCHSGKEPISGGEGSGGTMREESKVELYDCEEGCPVKELDKQAPKAGNAYKATRKKKTTGGSGDSWTNGGKEEGQDNGIYDGLGGASRFFYCPKVSTKERNSGGIKNNHPTVKPINLMKWLVKLVSKQGQTVFDPFTGSGSTGMACVLLDREFIGTELDPDYCDIAKQKIVWAKNERAKLEEKENKK